jgi:hypothetical protein
MFFQAVPARPFVLVQTALRQQLTDGGFALTGKVSDPDITAMALQALAPYYNSGKAYTYTQKITGREITKTVKQIIDGSLSCLSRLQTTDGDFLSWGTQNVESTCQVTVALCCLGIDPQLDARFIKNGKTLLDGIMLYRMPDGGFVHSYTYDNENPTSLPDESNTMAGEQVLYTMAAVWRQIKGMRTLYDFRPEIGEADITGGPVVFTNEDKLAADSLPNPPATEQYVTVVKLLEKLEMSDVFEGKEAYRTKLESAKTEIDAIQKEIDSLNADIHAQLYPLESLTLVDRVNVNTIVQRYNALSPYDRTKIERWEDVIKTKTKLDNQLRGLIIGGVLLAVAMGVTVTVIMRVKKRKLTKRVAMEELAAEYGDEGE